MAASSRRPQSAPHDAIGKANAQKAQKQGRHILFVSSASSPCIEADLIRSVFDQANRIPDQGKEYFLDHLSLDAEGYFCSEPRKLPPLNQAGNPSAFAFDMVIVTSSHETTPLRLQPQTLSRIRAYCDGSRRIVALAGGVFHLAAADLLAGREVVVHWSLHRKFADTFPRVSVRSDTLYNRDGHIYTCAGGLTSIDLGLQLIEDDLGRVATAHLSELMLLSQRRTSVCSQVSLTLKAQNRVSNPISELLTWLPDQLASDLSIAKLARRVAMSPRNFARRFQEQVKKTPARYIEELRFEAAKRELFLKETSIAEAASSSGLNSAESLRRLFHRRLGVTPKTFRDQIASLR